MWQLIRGYVAFIKSVCPHYSIIVSPLHTVHEALSSITSWQIDGEKAEMVRDFIFLGSKITADGDCSHKIKRHLLLGRKAMTNLDSSGKQRHHFANKGPYSQSCYLSSSLVQMWQMNHKESWALKNWFFWIVVLEKILEESLRQQDQTSQS